MTRTAIERDPLFAGEYAHRATLPMAANILLLAGTIACVNTTGYAVEGVDDNNGFRAVGIVETSVDNRTSTPEGGAAGAKDVEILYGVFGCAFTGTAPIHGQRVYVVDNQTVSVDNDSGTRGFAGVVSHVEGTVAYVSFSPDSNVAADVTALVTHATSAYAYVPIPLTSFVAADGTPLAVFADSANATFGLNVADSEAFGIRWNNHATPGTIQTQLSLPYDLDAAEDAQLEFLCSKTGATAGDATTLTITAFMLAVGDLHNADANAGGVSNALVGNATARTTALLSRTLAAADIPADVRTLAFTVTPTAGLLGTDDLIIHSAGLRYQRRLMGA